MGFYLFNENGSKWLGVGFYTMRMGRSGFLFNENGSEWVGVVFHTTQMGRSGWKWVFIQ